MKNFFKLDKLERNNIIIRTAKEFDLPFEIIEKDIWLCWILEILFKLPERMTFKGGTSLSKLGYIKRFSEDIHPTV
jgi:predicted nucleotidyltransferase component of viral defense system